MTTSQTRLRVAVPRPPQNKLSPGFPTPNRRKTPSLWHESETPRAERVSQAAPPQNQAPPMPSWLGRNWLVLVFCATLTAILVLSFIKGQTAR